ncbi:M23 family metallopeptidase [Candidatus Woesearchaeota archaeon]|nr:M23 family metallopeptidase [Candidatus Woesearchaeota archaeon]
MVKRAQVSLFIVIGLLVLLLGGLLVALQRNNLSEKAGLDQLALRQGSLMVENYVDSCLEASLLKAEALGLKAELRQAQEKLIDAELSKCTDFSSLNDKGISVSRGDVKTDVYLSGSAFGAYARYPITLSMEGQKVGVEDFTSELRLETLIPLDQDENGLKAEKNVVSSDKRVELRIPEGVLITKGGRLLDKISIKSLDKPEISSPSEAVVGNLIYGGYPDEAEFDGDVELTIHYDGDNLALSESGLFVAYYDKESGLWKYLYSMPDLKNNRITAKIRHFSEFAVVHLLVGEGFSQSGSIYSNTRVAIPGSGFVDVSDAAECYPYPIQAFPVLGDSWFYNDWREDRSQGKGAHEGTDILTPSEGSPVVAVVPGSVRRRYCDSLGGNALELLGDSGAVYYYAHLSSYGQFSEGQRVRAGDILGYSGTTIGCSCSGLLCGISGQTVPHLHFGIYVNWKAQNPYCALRGFKKGSVK